MHSLLLLVPCYPVGSTPADRLLSPGTCMREVASQCRASQKSQERQGMGSPGGVGVGNGCGRALPQLQLANRSAALRLLGRVSLLLGPALRLSCRPTGHL